MRPGDGRIATSKAHQAHGSQACAASAPNQSVAPQPISQPLSAPTTPTMTASGTGRRRSRASRQQPAASAARCAPDTAAACAPKDSGNCQTATTTAFTKIEKVPYWYSPARFPQAQEYGLSSGQCPSCQDRATSASTGRMEIW